MTVRHQRAFAAAIAVTLAVPAFVAPSTGWAQIEEIVVTTRRKAENLQEVPVAVAAFSEEMLEKQGIASTADIVGLVPGVQFDQSFSAADTRISIRGINSTRGRTSVAILMDGVDVSGENVTAGGGSSLLNSRLLDLERVEIVKGPQAALYGRNAFAGAINYITKKPSMDGLRLNAYADVADYGTYDLRGSISGPVIEDTLALSFNAGVYETDGYYDNHNPNDPGANGSLGGAESSGARIVALWTPSETWTVTANVSYTENDFDPRAVAKIANANRFYNQLGQLVVNPDGTPVTTPDFRAANPLCQVLTGPPCETDPPFEVAQWYGQWNGTVHSVSENQIALSRSHRNEGPFEGSHDEQWFTYLKAEWAPGPVILKSTTSYLDNEAWLHEDVDFQDGVGTPVVRELVSPDLSSAELVDSWFSLSVDYLDQTDTKYVGQEFTLESAEWDRGRWLIGASGFWEETVNEDFSVGWFNAPNFQEAFPSFCPPLFALDLACTFRQSVILGTPAKETSRDTNSYSLFGLVGYDLTDTVRLTAEARYIRDEIKVCTNTLVDRVSQYVLAYPIDYNIDELSEKLGYPVTLPICDKQTSDTVNPRFVVDYRMTDDVMFYGSVAKGTKPAGFGTAQFAIPQSAQIDQEKLWAYELGAKTSWLDRTLQANASVFYNDYTDRQVGITVTVAGDFAAAGVANAGAAETYGVELDLTWQPLDELTLAVAYAFTHAEWTDFNYPEIRASIQDGRYTPSSQARDKALCQNLQADCSGTRISGIPENSASAVANYTRAFNDLMDWFVNINATYEGERKLAESKIAPSVAANIIVDAQIGLQSDTWTVQLYANNLLDDDTVRWATYTQDFRDGMYGGGSGGEPRDNVAFAFLPPPRVVGLRATWKFE